MTDNDSIRLTDIQRYSVHDGPGIRTVVFFKGCPLRCSWCQNPETQSSEDELAVFLDRCIGCGECIMTCPAKAIAVTEAGPRTDPERCRSCGACARVCYSDSRCLYGKTLPVSEVFETAARDRVFFENSGGGVTLSGGEPLFQASAAAKLLSLIKASGIPTAVETCGYGSTGDFERVLEYTDHVLFDLKLMDGKRHVDATGTDNGLILENLGRAASSATKLIVRVPVVPGVNDDEENLRAIAGHAASIGVKEIHILAFHQAGRSKWDALRKAYPLKDLKVADGDSLVAAKKILEKAGLSVNVGGGGES